MEGSKRVIEKVNDSANNVRYMARKAYVKYLDGKISSLSINEAESWVKLQESEDVIAKKHPGASIGKIMDAELSNSEHRKYLDKWLSAQDRVVSLKQKKGSISQKIQEDQSSLAAFERLSDKSYIYKTVAELLADRVLVEKFHPNGKSSYDFTIEYSRVSSIKNTEIVEKWLQTSISGVGELDQEAVEAILAFGDARLLGKQHDYEGIGVSCFGEQMKERISQIRSDNAETAKATAKNGEDMKTFLVKDKELSTMEDAADIMTASAMEYYDKMMEMLPEE